MPLVLATAATATTSAVPVSTAVNGLFPRGTAGQAADYVALELRNDGNGTLTGLRLYITADPTGGGYAVAVLDGTARPAGAVYIPAPASGSYSSPTTSATGLVLPDLAAGQKCLIGVRRDLSSATVPPDQVERNAVRVYAAAAPLTYT